MFPVDPFTTIWVSSADMPTQSKLLPAVTPLTQLLMPLVQPDDELPEAP
jgi:hypothetical protein